MNDKTIKNKKSVYKTIEAQVQKEIRQIRKPVVDEQSKRIAKADR